MQSKSKRYFFLEGFDFQEHQIPLRSFILILLAIFVIETLIMEFLINIVNYPIYVDILLDSFILVILILPVLYFTFLRPMVRQYREMENARQAMETLWRASMDLARTMEVDRVYQIVLDHVARLAPYDTAVICLLTAPNHMDVEAIRDHLDDLKTEKITQTWLNPNEYPLLTRPHPG